MEEEETKLEISVDPYTDDMRKNAGHFASKTNLTATVGDEAKERSTNVALKESMDDKITKSELKKDFAVAKSEQGYEKAAAKADTIYRKKGLETGSKLSKLDMQTAKKDAKAAAIVGDLDRQSNLIGSAGQASVNNNTTIGTTRLANMSVKSDVIEGKYENKYRRKRAKKKAKRMDSSFLQDFMNHPFMNFLKNWMFVCGIIQCVCCCGTTVWIPIISTICSIISKILHKRGSEQLSGYFALASLLIFFIGPITYFATGGIEKASEFLGGFMKKK